MHFSCDNTDSTGKVTDALAEHHLISTHPSILSCQPAVKNMIVKLKSCTCRVGKWRNNGAATRPPPLADTNIASGKSKGCFEPLLSAVPTSDRTSAFMEWAFGQLASSFPKTCFSRVIYTNHLLVMIE